MSRAALHGPALRHRARLGRDGTYGERSDHELERVATSSRSAPAVARTPAVRGHQDRSTVGGGTPAPAAEFAGPRLHYGGCDAHDPGLVASAGGPRSRGVAARPTRSDGARPGGFDRACRAAEHRTFGLARDGIVEPVPHSDTPGARRAGR